MILVIMGSRSDVAAMTPAIELLGYRCQPVISSVHRTPEDTQKILMMGAWWPQQEALRTYRECVQRGDLIS